MAESSPEESPPITKAPLPFQPSPDQLLQMPLFKQNCIPRYLIRLHAKETAGTTTLSCAIPPASTCGETRDIFRLQSQDAAALLNAHLRWWPSHESECNLISWTSSLLFALQYGLYRHYRSRDDSPALSQIFLLILDTRGFPGGTFVKDLEIAEAFAQYSETNLQQNLNNFLQFRKSNRGYYFGEYLIQGDLNIQGRCVQTTMQRIINAGLFELSPELGDHNKWDQWAKRVVSLREPLKVSQDAPSTTHAEFRKAITMAETCFGDCWVVSVTAMLLALKYRKKNDPVIVDGFAAMFSAEEIEALSLGDIKTDADRLPEVKQFQRLIDDIYHRFTRKDINQLLNPFTNLTITNSTSR